MLQSVFDDAKGILHWDLGEKAFHTIASLFGGVMHCFILGSVNHAIVSHLKIRCLSRRLFATAWSGVLWLSKSSSPAGSSLLADSNNRILSLGVFTVFTSYCMEHMSARHLSLFHGLDSSLSSCEGERHTRWNQFLQGPSHRMPSSSLPQIPQFQQGGITADVASSHLLAFDLLFVTR